MIDTEKIKALAEKLREDYRNSIKVLPWPYRSAISSTPMEAADAIDLLLAELEAANNKASYFESACALADDTIDSKNRNIDEIVAFNKQLLAELEAAAADKRDNVRRWTREDMQNKALEHGLKYWRAPDAHGVEGTKQQTVDLLQDLLGVEVEIKDASQDRPWEIAGIDVPDDEREVMVFLNGDCALCDWDGRKGGGWGIRLGFYDHNKRYWRVHGCREDFVTHWRDLPDGPATAVKNIAALAQR
ncbi:TPA: hypothetical protein QDA78_003699 [Burkholderia vietnamiensis]|nr:hypothetical protein [Burkholderia vietnamiensis]